MAGKRKKRELKTYMFYIIGVCSVALIIAFGTLLGRYYLQSKQEKDLQDELGNLRQEALNQDADTQEDAEGMEAEGDDGSSAAKEKKDNSQSLSDFYEQMRQMNNDYRFWVSIPGTDIDYPVVYRDQTYYLNHDFEGKYNGHGTIFLDEHAVKLGNEMSNILLLHGHHMKDGSMFHDLTKYKKKDYRDAHLQITLQFEKEIVSYTVVGAGAVDLLQEGFFDYTQIPDTEEEKETYLKQLEKSCFWLNTEQLSKEDELVILATCNYRTEDDRMLVIARREP